MFTNKENHMLNDVYFKEDVQDVIVDMFKKAAIDLINNAITYESKEPLVDVAKLIFSCLILKGSEHDFRK